MIFHRSAIDTLQVSWEKKDWEKKFANSREKNLFLFPGKLKFIVFLVTKLDTATGEI